MGKLKILFLGITIFLISGVVFNKFFYIENTTISEFNIGKKINIYGQIIIKKGNNMPINSKNIKSYNKSIKYVIAVQGKLNKTSSSPEININQINSNINKIKLNNDGSFKSKLKPGTYTFLIKTDDKAYLNKFDGLGFYKSKRIDKNNNRIKLIYDKYELR